jgi:hypothetical protein
LCDGRKLQQNEYKSFCVMVVSSHKMSAGACDHHTKTFILILLELVTITQKLLSSFCWSLRPSHKNFYTHFAGAYNHHTKTFILILRELTTIKNEFQSFCVMVTSSSKMSIKVFV